MKLMTEEQSLSLITHEIAYQATKDALIAAADDRSEIFPTVAGYGSKRDDRFVIKSGTTSQVTGLKVGTYWPGNLAKGIENHQSVILLFDQSTGQIEWVIEAGEVNAYRTAASNAVAADALAKRDASVLAVFGAGHQAFYECIALSKVRPITKVLVAARNPERGAKFAERLQEAGFHAEVANAQDACAEAQIIVTVTPACAPLFEAQWVRPGTHVVSMGSDCAGQQELPPALFERGHLFCDLPSQSVVIGEFQHFTGDKSSIAAIGDVLTGKKLGRTSEDEITIYDSSGISLQDLFTAKHLVSAFMER